MFNLINIILHKLPILKLEQYVIIIAVLLNTLILVLMLLFRYKNLLNPIYICIFIGLLILDFCIMYYKLDIYNFIVPDTLYEDKTNIILLKNDTV